jgi:hypothetical protein
VLSPEVLLALLLFQSADAGRRGYQGILEGFWEDARTQGVALPCAAPVSAAAYCQARAKLPAEAVRAVLHRVCDSFDVTHGDRFRWKGRRLLAADGTGLALQRSEALIAHFGAQRGAHHPTTHLVTLYDVLAGLPLDVAVAAHQEHDSTLLPDVLGRARAGDVLILDRGFPGYDLLAWLLSEQIDFVVRLPVKRWLCGKRFVESGARDGTVTLNPTPFSELKDGGPITLRAVRIETPGGEPCVVLTSLSEATASTAEVAALYRMRWQVEEHYKAIQSHHFGQRTFHSRAPDGVAQEIYAQALLLAVSRHLAASAAERTGVPIEEIQAKAALFAAAACITRLALASMDPAELVRVLERIARARQPKRPGRSFPRRSFQRQSAWGPYGKRRTAKRGDSPKPLA